MLTRARTSAPILIPLFTCILILSRKNVYYSCIMEKWLTRQESQYNEKRRLSMVTSASKFFVMFLGHYPQPHSTPGTGRNNMTFILKRHSNRSNLVLLCCLVPSFCKTFAHLYRYR